jgi:alpha-mannosidase
MLEACRRLADFPSPSLPHVKQGTARAFFERLDRALAGRDDVPVWDNELYLEYHRGTYTSQARQKLRNALAQRLYHAAELYAALARVTLGVDYPRAELEAGWRLILSNQFHDVLPGSAIGQVYVDAEADFLQVTAIGQNVLDGATAAIAGAVQLEREALVVFNPGPYPSADYLELPADGAVPGQPTCSGGVLAFFDGVPPNGYRAYPLAAEPAPVPATGQVQVTPGRIDTPFWTIDLDQAGRLTGVWDKTHRRQALADGELGNRLVVFEDKPLNYDAWDIDVFHTRKFHDVDHLESLRVLENGPERGVLELTWRYGERSRITQRLSAYARVPRIDFVTEVDWQERQSLLKVAFPTPIRNRRATYEIQFGTIDRPTHRNTSWEQAAFEVPAQRWVDLSDAHYGVAVLSDCKHGYSAAEHTLWLSLLKSAVDPDPEADRGLHRFTYSLLPHAAGFAEVRRAAYALTRPLVWRREPAHAGRLPMDMSLFATSSPGVIAETAKWAEDADALVLRLYEADGGATDCLLSTLPSLGRVEEVDLLERHPRPVAERLGAGVPLHFRAREVKTLSLA